MSRRPFSPSEIDSRSVVGNKPYSRFALVLPVFAVLMALLFILSGFGSRWGWWHFSTGFTIMQWCAYGGIGLALLSGIAIYRIRKKLKNRQGVFPAAAALGVGLLLFLIPLGLMQFAQNYPPIHDITTDTENPPSFDAIVPLRANAPNPPAYEGEETARQQREAYPHLSTLSLNRSFDDAFEQALRAARDMSGWEIVAYDRQDGRIEATDQTFWYGFKDDVVIRLQEDGNYTNIDVRSKSRVGAGDLGVNARRVENYLDEVRR